MAEKRLKWDEAASAADNARLRLPALAAEYFEQGRALVAAELTPEALHAFRLRTKRLRYTLELFRTFYGPGMEKCLASLRELQVFLGDLNDYASTRKLAGEVLPDPASPHRRRLERLLQARTLQRLAGFQEYWRNTFDAPAQEERWRRYLGRTR